MTVQDSLCLEQAGADEVSGLCRFIVTVLDGNSGFIVFQFRSRLDDKSSVVSRF